MNASWMSAGFGLTFVALAGYCACQMRRTQDDNMAVLAFISALIGTGFAIGAVCYAR